MPKVAISYSSVVGGSSVVSLQKSFKEFGAEIVDADYRQMMAEIPAEEFDKLYSSPEGRAQLFAHAKAKAIELLDDVDCLALPGNNAMIDPELFNQERDLTQPYDFSRTIIELALLHVAIGKGMPIFGACGGHQVVAVYGGGEIVDLTIDQLTQQSYMNYDAIRINNDTMLAQIVGKYLDEHYEGQFFGAHSQRVSKQPEGFIASSIASDGITIESFESVNGAPIITTQFHPEVGAMGLPESSFIYRRNSHDTDMSMSIFQFMNEAAIAYNQKKSVVNELKQFKPVNDACLKPSEVKNAAEVNDNRLTDLPDEKPEKTEKASYWMVRLGVSLAVGLASVAGAVSFFPLVWLGFLGSLGLAAVSVGAGLLMAGITYGVSELALYVATEVIGPFIASGVRGGIAKGMTTFLVNEIQSKEDAALSAINDVVAGDQEPDKNTKYGAFFEQKDNKIANKTPQQLLIEIESKVWTNDVAYENNDDEMQERTTSGLSI